MKRKPSVAVFASLQAWCSAYLKDHLVAIGYSKPTEEILIYTQGRLRLTKKPRVWNGYTVRFVRAGRVKPAVAS